ncbi:MAG: hypothetical protein ABWY45_22550 [Mycobacterium sp.]
MSSDPLLGAVLTALVIGAVGGSVPLWKSATLSPDSVERLVYWSCSAVVVVLGSVSQLPYWQGAFFVGGCSAIALAGIAFYWTNHVKIGGRVYAAFEHNRRPDRPPALSSEDRD